MLAEDHLKQDAHLLKPIYETGRNFWIVIAILGVCILWGAVAYITQLWRGLGVTGMNQPITWGFYITNFVFFIGISHAGTLISAILRMAQAEWRRPITRMAEVITVAVLFIGAGNILVDLGRPDRMLNLILYGRYQSPLLWDATSVSAYICGSILYLYLPLIPDMAILRDQGRKFNWLYSVMAMGWTGTERQKRFLNRSMGIMAILVIPIAVSVHSVVSFVFSMTLQPMWHSTIFGPYFVVGAIFSGIAALIIAMALFRKVYHLEGYLKPIHFNNISLLMLVMSCLWFYFTFAEYLTGWYGNEPEEMKVFMAKISGPFAVYFWTMVVCNVPLPILLLARKRTIVRCVLASIGVLIGMWLERFLIVVPTLINPRLEYPHQMYIPSWVEVGETVGSFAVFILLYILFSKVFPIISIWEIQEGREVGMDEIEERWKAYQPD